MHDIADSRYPHIVQEPGKGPEDARVLDTGTRAREIVRTARHYEDLDTMMMTRPRPSAVFSSDWRCGAAARMIGLLTEGCRALITAAVTVQIDVATRAA